MFINQNDNKNTQFSPEFTIINASDVINDEFEKYGYEFRSFYYF